MHRFLPLLLLTILVPIFLFSFYLPFKRLILYKVGFSFDPTTSCCRVEDILNSGGRFDENAQVAIFNNQIIDYPKTSLAENIQNTTYSQGQVLGAEANSNKWIEISLSEQKLRAWEGDRIVTESLISSGRWYPTPTGNFSIWYKTRAQRMKGGSKELGTFYDLPNVPHNMFFYQGFAIHGAYWHNNFGHPMSHGCVNAPLTFAAQLFDWSGPYLSPGQWTVRASPDNPGTRVYIHS